MNEAAEAVNITRYNKQRHKQIHNYCTESEQNSLI
jgi:hypothetical protein